MAFVPYMAAGFAVDKLMGGDGLKGAALGGLGGAGLTGAFGGGAATAGGASSVAGPTSMMQTLATPTFTTGAGTGIGGAGMTTIGANTPMGLSNATQFGSVNPLTTGSFSEGISAFTPKGIPGTVGGNTGLFGQLTSNQTLNSALTADKGLLNTALENTPIGKIASPVGDLLGQAQSGIDKGWEDMSNLEKAQAGMGVASLGTQDDTKNRIQAQAPVVIPGKPTGTGVTAANVGINVQRPFTEYAATTYSVPREEEIRQRNLLGY